ncbi:hypothetical protein Fmac_021008 [Flemingia macrophylla]|uniref:Uncharacterized protein n=1 Tax=Flemingia macrophylla TaxID=520843 RepID=A0ABD1LVP3_9FABA
MSLARKKQKMELECGRKVSRGEIWIATHKHTNGEFVNEEAKKLEMTVSRGPVKGGARGSLAISLMLYGAPLEPYCVKTGCGVPE